LFIENHASNNCSLKSCNKSEHYSVAGAPVLSKLNAFFICRYMLPKTHKYEFLGKTIIV